MYKSICFLRIHRNSLIRKINSNSIKNFVGNSDQKGYHSIGKKSAKANQYLLTSNTPEFTAFMSSSSSTNLDDQPSSKIDPKEAKIASESQLSIKDKLKLAVRDYGSTVIIFHVTVSLCSLGTCYMLVSSGLDVLGFLRWLGIDEAHIQILTGGSTFLLAYGVHKVFAAPRIALTLAVVPFIVRKLRSIGIFKKP